MPAGQATLSVSGMTAAGSSPPSAKVGNQRWPALSSEDSAGPNGRDQLQTVNSALLRPAPADEPASGFKLRVKGLQPGSPFLRDS